MKAAHIAKKNHIKIYTIGLGAQQQVVNGILGPQLYNPSQDLDESLLKDISKLTGGQYFRAKDTQGLEQIYQEINALEPVATDGQAFRPIHPYYYIPLCMAFVCFLLLALMPVFFSLCNRQPRTNYA
jgi:Ca-activated chloride channel family protein